MVSSPAIALPRAPAAAVSASPIRVLIADDSAVVRGLVARWITEAGFTLGRHRRQRPPRPGDDGPARPGRGASRHRHAGTRRHRGSAAHARREPEPAGRDDVDADDAQRRHLPEMPRARGGGLHRQAGEQPRGDHLGCLPRRPHRAGPPCSGRPEPARAALHRRRPNTPSQRPYAAPPLQRGREHPSRCGRRPAASPRRAYC